MPLGQGPRCEPGLMRRRGAGVAKTDAAGLCGSGIQDSISSLRIGEADRPALRMKAHCRWAFGLQMADPAGRWDEP